jgi:hypothetical protein
MAGSHWPMVDGHWRSTLLSTATARFGGPLVVDHDAVTGGSVSNARRTCQWRAVAATVATATSASVRWDVRHRGSGTLSAVVLAPIYASGTEWNADPISGVPREDAMHLETQQ